MSAPFGNSAWTVIFNPKAGYNGSGRRRRLQKALDDFDIEFQWLEPNSLDESSTLLRQLCDGGQRNFLAVGGDGTNHHTLNILLQTLEDKSQLRYGLLPWGTGNDWAEHLGLDHRATTVAKSIQSSSFKEVRLGSLSFPDLKEHRFFTNTLGLGFDAFVVDRMRGRRKIGKVSYILEVLRSLGKFQPSSLNCRIDDRRREEEVFSLHLGLGPSTGGGLQITPHAKVRDPQQLAYTLIYPDRMSRYIKGLPRLLTGKIEDLSFTETGFLEELTVPLQDNEFIVESDGEICGKAPFTVRMHTQKLNLLNTSRVI